MISSVSDKRKCYGTMFKDAESLLLKISEPKDSTDNCIDTAAANGAQLEQQILKGKISKVIIKSILDENGNYIDVEEIVEIDSIDGFGDFFDCGDCCGDGGGE